MDYKQILDYIYSQPEVGEQQDDFEEYTTEQKSAVLLSLSEIWEESEYKWKERSTTFNTVIDQISYDLPYGKVQALKESTASYTMQEKPDFGNLSLSSGKPSVYCLKNNKINLYPTPDAVYTINLDYLTDYKAISSSGVEKDTLELETDVLNIPAYIENHFLMVLSYKTALNEAADTTEDIYAHALNNYTNGLKLLKIKSNRSSNKNSGFILL